MDFSKETLEYLGKLDADTRDKIVEFIKNIPTHPNLNGLTRAEKRRVRLENTIVAVAAAGTAYAATYDFDKRNGELIGIATILSDDMQIPNSTLEMNIDTHEVFQTGTPLQLIHGSVDVPTDQRPFSQVYRELNNGRQSQAKLIYTDGNGIGFAAYNVNITFIVLCKEGQEY